MVEGVVLLKVAVWRRDLQVVDGGEFLKMAIMVLTATVSRGNTSDDSVMVCC